MSEHPPSSDAPAAVRAAAVVFALYGVYVVVNATVWQLLGEWQESADYPRALIRLVGMLAVAWGLWRLHRWAWWIAVGFGSLWLVAGAAGLATAARFAPDGVPLPLPALVTSLLGAAFLAAGVTLLLLPRSRAAFRVK